MTHGVSPPPVHRELGFDPGATGRIDGDVDAEIWTTVHTSHSLFPTQPPIRINSITNVSWDVQLF